jgi:hypothetical protein
MIESFVCEMMRLAKSKARGKPVSPEVSSPAKELEAFKTKRPISVDAGGSIKVKSAEIVMQISFVRLICFGIEAFYTI